MAVLTSKRQESNLQFLDNALALEVYTIKRCVRFPKRYQHLFGDPLCRLSMDVLNNAKAANSIYPVNEHEVQARRDYLTRAQVAVQQMISQIDVARIMFEEENDYQPKESSWLTWLKLMDDEARLISGVRKSDRERFKSITG